MQPHVILISLLYKNSNDMVGAELLLRMYRTMVLIRCFEDTVERLFKQGEIPGFLHVYKGEEAVAVGVCTALRDDDYVTSTHRGHGHAIAKGVDVKILMAELMGKATGTNKGLGGSMHIAWIEKGFLGANGIAGGGIPHSLGAAFASKYKGLDRVSVAFFGEGAASQGVFYESLNIAALWRLPVIFVCENNQYAVTTHISKQTAVSEIHRKAQAFGIPSLLVDGMDVVAVYNAAVKAVERARKGEGPSFIECQTYRYGGHYVGDPEKYRDKEEVKKWMEKDPLKIMKNRLVGSGMLSNDEDAKIWEWARVTVEDAVKFARESPYIDFNEVRTLCV